MASSLVLCRCRLRPAVRRPRENMAFRRRLAIDLRQSIDLAGRMRRRPFRRLIRINAEPGGNCDGARRPAENAPAGTMAIG